jgi:hypothetical protein
LQVRLGVGWALSGSPTVAYRTTVTLSCLIEELPSSKTKLVEAVAHPGMRGHDPDVVWAPGFPK